MNSLIKETLIENFSLNRKFYTLEESSTHEESSILEDSC